MEVPTSAALLRIYTRERARDGARPLHEAIVMKARAQKLAGATVLRGPMGFGQSRRLHNANILDLSGDLPLVIEIVDAEDKLRAFCGSLGELKDIGLVTLEKVTGEAARGELAMSSKLDFRGEVTKMDFGLAVQKLVLASLPERWGLKNALEGELTGWANLRLTIREGKLKTEGKGEGKINNARVFGAKVDNPIPLKLEAYEKGFKFSSPAVPAKAGLLITRG